MSGPLYGRWHRMRAVPAGTGGVLYECGMRWKDGRRRILAVEPMMMWSHQMSVQKKTQRVRFTEDDS